MTSTKREMKALMRRTSASEAEKYRLDLLYKWCDYCLSANIDADSKYLGAGLISMVAPEKLDTALEFGKGYAVVKGNDYTFRIRG